MGGGQCVHYLEGHNNSEQRIAKSLEKNPKMKFICIQCCNQCGLESFITVNLELSS